MGGRAGLATSIARAFPQTFAVLLACTTANWEWVPVSRRLGGFRVPIGWEEGGGAGGFDGHFAMFCQRQDSTNSKCSTQPLGTTTGSLHAAGRVANILQATSARATFIVPVEFVPVFLLSCGRLSTFSSTTVTSGQLPVTDLGAKCELSVSIRSLPRMSHSSNR